MLYGVFVACFLFEVDFVFGVFLILFDCYDLIVVGLVFAAFICCCFLVCFVFVGGFRVIGCWLLCDLLVIVCCVNSVAVGC